MGKLVGFRRPKRPSRLAPSDVALVGHEIHRGEQRRLVIHFDDGKSVFMVAHECGCADAYDVDRVIHMNVREDLKERVRWELGEMFQTNK